MRAKNYYPPTTKIKNKSGFGAIRTLLLTCLLMLGFTVASYATTPTYALIPPQGFSTCQEQAHDFTSLLPVNDPDGGETITWTISAPSPAKGVVTWTTNTANSGIGVTPVGFVYTPNPGATGADVIHITADDGNGGSVVIDINVTINALPTAITGPTTVCRTQSIQLASTPTGGTWASSNPSEATVDLNTGVVTGAGAANGGVQNVTITYTNSVTGCSTSTTVSVNRLSEINLGASELCAYSGSTTASNATFGGAWSSTVAPVTPTGFGNTATVTAQGPGTALITYTMPSGCRDTASMIINPLPQAIIVGTTNQVCETFTISFSDQTPGGTWTVDNGSVATVNATGNVTGIAFGTTTLSYTLLPSGCATSTPITVNQVPVIGTSNACIGQPINLSVIPGGGTWTTSDTNITLTPSGVVTGTSAGTANVTYTTASGCVSSASLTINPAPGPISGTTVLCQGSSVTLSDPTPAGTWTSFTGNVSIVSGTGVMTGVNAGDDIVSYTLATGCYATTTVTVNPMGSIAGSDRVCKGASVSLFMIPSTPGGTWSSSNANATIDPNTGDLTGVDVGTTTITYSTAAGCFTTRTQFIDSLPHPITGTMTVCAGSTTTLSDAGGGSWFSNNTFVANIDMGTGVVTGNNAGDAEIVYVLPFPSSCATTATVTVHPNDPIIGGNVELCIGSTAELSNPNAGGTWSASNTTSSVDPVTGIVTAVAPGIDTITYTTTFGCTSTTEITVNPQPDTISGTTNVCEGLTTNLFNATPGGAWSSANTDIAVVDGSGVVTGVSAGVVDITYTMPSGCFVTKAVTVNPVGVITGIPYACTGLTTNLFGTPSGGNWLVDVADIAIASVNFNTGVVTGLSAGVATIDYITTAGCVSTIEVTVGVAPPIVAADGTTSVCAGSSITLSDVAIGGTWSSDNTLIATVAPTAPGVGEVTGVSAGNVDITYTLNAGCYSTINITVNPLPVIPVSDEVCQISTINLSEPGGGFWSTTDTNIFVDPFFGVVLGITPGPATVTYTFIGTGCFSTTSITVNPIPEAITGNMVLCPGVSTYLSDPTPGGVWSSTNPGVATIDPSTGMVTGVTAGLSFISYTLSTGCAAVSAVIVNNTLLTPITGPASVCVGQQIDLDQLALGGTWTSMDPSVGAVDPVSGVVTGISAGTTIITYAMSGTCESIHSVQVFELSTTQGNPAVCVGGTDTLTNATFGGSWASTDGSLATVDPMTGVVYGVSAGNVTIEYILPSGCVDTFDLTVNPVPTAIGNINPGVCMQDSIMLTNGIAGGTWTSSDVSVATIDTFTGEAFAVSVGYTLITYSLPTGCGPQIDTLHVNALPVLTSPHNPPAICNGTMFTYSATATVGYMELWNRLDNPKMGTPGITGSINIGEVLTNTSPDTANVYYAIILKDTNSNCVTYDTIMVVVNPTPRLLSTATSNVCDSSLFEFISTSATTGVTYTWFRDAVTGISNPAASGTGDTIREYLKNTTPNQIVVTYLDTLWFDGCWHVDTVKVTVNPTPRLSTPKNAGAICDSATFVYTSASLTPSVTYTWHRPAVTGIANAAASGTGNVITEQLFNTTPNPITVTYLDTLWFDGCNHVDSVKVIVNPTPKLNSGLTPPAICDSILFSYTPTSLTAGAAFTWVRNYTPGINLLAGSGTGNPNEVLINTSNIDIAVTYHYTITANGCSHNENVVVIVHPRPRLSSDPGPLTVCSHSTFEYLPTGYVLGTTFAWSRAQVAGVSPNTGSGTGTIVEVLIDSLLTPKTVNYKIVMTGIGGCKDSTYLPVIVNPSYVTPEITTHAPGYVCQHTMFQNFGVANAAPAGVEYTWTAKNATVWATGNPDQYALVSFDSTAGDAWVTVTTSVNTYGCPQSSSFYVNVSSTRADDIQIIYYNGQLMCLNNEQDTYQWGYDDALTLDSAMFVGETNQTYFINSPDFVYRLYWVMTKHNGCEQKSYYHAPVGVNDVNGDDMQVKVYPNPATDILNVDINTKAGGKFEIEVVDVLGQKINTVTPVNHKATINVAGLAPGVYMVECYRDGVKFNASRFIKN